MFQEVGMEEKLRFPENVVYREEPGGAILFNVDTGEMRIVEDVAWGICSMINEGTDKPFVLATLRKKYPDQDGIEKDMENFLGELEEADMLKRDD